MWNDRNIVSRRHCGHLDQLGQTTHPHDIGLDDIDVSSFDEFPESIFGVLVFACGEFDAWTGFFELCVCRRGKGINKDLRGRSETA